MQTIFIHICLLFLSSLLDCMEIGMMTALISLVRIYALLLFVALAGIRPSYLFDLQLHTASSLLMSMSEIRQSYLYLLGFCGSVLLHFF